MSLMIGILEQTTSGGGGGGGFPIIADNLYDEDSAVPFDTVMPAVVNADDLLILFGWRSFGSGTLTGSAIAGWTLLDSSSAYALYYRWASGTEDSGTTALGVAGSLTMSFIVLRITGADPTKNPEIAVGGIANGTSSTPDPPAVDPSWADANNLLIAVAGLASNFTISAYPTSYGLYHANDVGSRGASAVAAKEVSVSASDNPSAFTASGTDLWYAFTLAVKGT